VSTDRVCGTCAGCMQPFERKRQSGDIGKFCSRQCYFDMKARRAAERATQRQASSMTACVVCGVAVDGRRKVCGDACEKARARLRYRETYQHKTIGGVCPVCLKFWQATGRKGPSAGYCSRECGQRAAKMSGSARRRAAAHGVTYEPVAILKVLQRDGWRCRICGIHTPQRLRGTGESNAPEVDHIVPMAMGGGHTYDNVQCACRACNKRKGSRWKSTPREITEGVAPSKTLAP
jgi:hypothetical protein